MLCGWHMKMPAYSWQAWFVYSAKKHMECHAHVAILLQMAFTGHIRQHHIWSYSSLYRVPEISILKTLSVLKDCIQLKGTPSAATNLKAQGRVSFSQGIPNHWLDHGDHLTWRNWGPETWWSSSKDAQWVGSKPGTKIRFLTLSCFFYLLLLLKSVGNK